MNRILIIECCYDCKYLRFKHDPKPYCGYTTFDKNMKIVKYNKRVIGSFKTATPSWCPLPPEDGKQ